MFSHITHFFGYKVILLGLFNGQKLPLEKEHAIKQMVAICKSHDRVEQSIFQESNGEMCPKVEVLVRETPDVEYIKVIVVDGRVKGAMLIGETGLEDTFENLILNQLDVSTISGHLLDPDIDIEDFFD
jgi:NAD(P)H-nitrite reductase large subunit